MKCKISKALIITLSFLLMQSCANTKQTSSIPPVVTASKPRVGDIELLKSFAGRVEEGRDVYVVPFVSGEVKKVYKAEGDYVHSGEALFEIDSSAAQQQVKTATAALNTAKAQADLSTGATIEMQIASIEAQSEQARIGLESAKESYDKAKDKKKDAESAVDSLKSSQSSLTSQIASLTAEIASLEAQASAAPLPPQFPQGDSGSSDLSAQIAQKKALLQRANESLSQTASALKEAQSGVITLESTLSQLETAVKQAQAGYDASKKSLSIAKQGMSDQTSNIASAGIAQATAAYDGAKLQLSFYTVKSPVDGVISRTMVKAHDVAAQGSPAYSIKTDGAALVSFYSSIESKDGLKSGMACTVKFQGAEYEGTISEVAASIDSQTGMYKVTAAVSKANGKLVNSAAARVDVPVPQTKASINIPIDSVYFEGDSAFVYKAIGNICVKTPIVCGKSGDTEIEALSGVTANDLIINTWSAKLRDGAEVSIEAKAGAPDGAN